VNTTLRLALYQPDMPSNTGTMMRLCACLGIGLDIIEPCGFVLDDAKLRRAAMDYIDYLDCTRHRSWNDFSDKIGDRRLVLLTTKAAIPYTEHAFRSNDIIMVGRESAGVPDVVHNRADARILIPLNPPLRSLNVAISAAMAIGEALRQCPAQNSVSENA
jgi:tRNA (cytidine/uridine-2'-O-)-methyltransferase